MSLRTLAQTPSAVTFVYVCSIIRLGANSHVFSSNHAISKEFDLSSMSSTLVFVCPYNLNFFDNICWIIDDKQAIFESGRYHGDQAWETRQVKS